ncbi:unnamed protein product [Eruca vesicaria subsp. sativa]|uniref:Legume lectin domain-containing protein n=1 Tax=Eruca vesicaria subsp. sativa TaxID=29727 RepID=A0ABC8KU08_ERUVS|nr:unnamed protein product [Eruca vesicaria subsp. sativa]
MIRGLLLGIIWMLNCVCPSFQQDTKFVFNGFRQEDHRLHLDGSARILPKNHILQLTNATTTQIGRAFFKKPVDFKPSEPVSFSTHFVCALLPAGKISGHGLAFFVSQSTDFIGDDPTRFFGIFYGNGSNSPRVLAVELDIAPDEDIDGNHVGIDVNSAKDVASAKASYYSDKEGRKIDIKLLSGDPIQVWVDYERTTLNVSLAPLGNHKPSRPLLSSTSINLTEIVQGRRMFVGFSGSTGRNLYAEVREEWEKEYGPLRFSYKSLYKATKGFSKSGFLGKGDSRPSMEQVVLYLNGNLTLPKFGPYSSGIGVLNSMASTPAQPMLPSLSLSFSSSNNSRFMTHSIIYGSGR